MAQMAPMAMCYQAARIPCPGHPPSSSSSSIPSLRLLRTKGQAPRMMVGFHPLCNNDQVRINFVKRMGLRRQEPLLPLVPALSQNAACYMRSRGRSCSLNGALSIRSGNFHPGPNTTAEAENNSKGSISKLELGRSGTSLKKRPSYNGIFLILLLNLGMFVGDHWLGLTGIQKLYLYHDMPRWYQFITSTFCHVSWNHLSSNLFFLYIFGKLVEEEGGGFGVWLSYLITGVGANLVSWLILPRSVVSAGASGAVFGLFAISVLVKLSFDWRKILEVLILGQFVVERVMEAAQASAQLGGRAYSSSMNINHIAHLSGALVGVALIWVLKKIPSGENEQK
ncbi:unnamed protein product [Calypogeia fissa]